MPIANQHIIGRQVLELDLQVPPHEAFETQQAFSTLFKQKVLPALSDLFDSLSDPDILIRLAACRDRLRDVY